MHVLVVEDDLAGRELLGMILESRGFSVTTCITAQEALATAPHIEPQLLVTDLMLGAGDATAGLELVGAFRSDPRVNSVPILVLTGITGPYDLARAREYGADACLPKPVDVSRLMVEIDNLVIGSRDSQ